MALFSIFLLIFPPWCGIIPMDLSRLTFSLLITKVSQDLTFIRIISGAVNDTGFRLALWSIYISFSTLARAITCCGVSLIQGGLSFIIDSVTRIFGILPGRFFIRSLYYTFVNIFCGFRTLKHVNIFLKWNVFTIKSLNIGLFIPDIRCAV